MERGIIRMLLIAIALPGFLLACSGNPRSITLALSLRPAMERTMRIVTEQRMNDAPRKTSTARRGVSAMSLSQISLTYAFRVASVDASGLATIESTLRAADLPMARPSLTRTVETLKKQHLTMTVDRSGRILQMKTDGPARYQVNGLPVEPGVPGTQSPAQGDLSALFSGLTGRTVSVGETWTSEMRQATGALGLKGTLHWTLSSLTRTSARLGFTGSLQAPEMTIMNLPSDSPARLAGDVSGFMELERDTGWPTRGKSVIRVKVTQEDTASASRNPTDRLLLSMSIITLFDEVP